MKKLAHAIVAIVAVSLLFGGASVLTAPAASAAVIQQSKQYLKAYSWTGYKAKVTPRGSYPTGTYYHSKSVTVKRSGATLVSGRQYWWAPSGTTSQTYTVYSKFRYKTRSKVTTYTTVKHSVYDVECSVGGWWVDNVVYESAGDDEPYGTLTAHYDGGCSGYYYNNSGEMRSTEWYAEWTQDEGWYGSPDGEGWYSGGGSPEAHTVSERVAHTSYKYSSYLTRTYKRTVVVTKVTNTSVMTRHEWNVLSSGDSLSRVRRVVGSRGRLEAMVGNTAYYSWKNVSGGRTWISFYYGEADGFWWYTS